MSLIQNFYISCLWFAYSAQWGALMAVVLPKQVEMIVGNEQKYIINGVIGFVGAFVALVVTPISGALSDRSTNPHGRRRNYLIGGVLLNALFLIALGQMTAPSTGSAQAAAIALGALVMGVQLGCNWWGGPYAGLIPDVVPESSRGTASSWMAMMNALGTIVGALGAGAMIGSGENIGPHLTLVYRSLAGMLCFFLMVTLAGIKEKPRTTKPENFEIGAFIRAFWIDPKLHTNFYWVLGTRALVAMGLYSVFQFFQYFLKDMLSINDAAAKAGMLIGIVTIAGMPSALISGPLSDKHGRKKLIYISGGIMCIATLLFISITKIPSLMLVYGAAAIFGIGYGAYQAVDWALAIDVLPSGEDSAKDMGIWHVSMVLPQMVGPMITGSILGLIKGNGMSLGLGYTLVFVLTSIWFILGTLFVRNVKTARG